MKTASIRDLRNEFPRVARWIEEGECVEITRSGKPFARLAPVLKTSPTSAPMPDFMDRLQKHFPSEMTTPDSVVDYDRGDR